MDSINTYTGHCTCQRVPFRIQLPQALSNYQARACDCDFCSQRSIQYLSHPNGTLEIPHNHSLQTLTQGSEQARFWQCTHCHDIIAATCEYPDGVRGAVNATLLDEKSQLQNPVMVSPMLLSAEEKRARWRGVWFLVVGLESKNESNH
jgi:hypothetical protein